MKPEPKREVKSLREREITNLRLISHIKVNDVRECVEQLKKELEDGMNIGGEWTRGDITIFDLIDKWVGV